ncbi:MAG: hypothetical protein U5Q44_11105 [Dehalococcoidia bacterium]|nr:hypothetical protein [Dehalococcoidia bacterium]
MLLTLVIVSAFRVAASLPVLRWPLAGALLAIAADLADLPLINLLDIGFMDHYQAWDKYIDQVYMATFLVVAIRWGGALAHVAVALVAFRLVGIGLMEFRDGRELLLFFPNVFEFWFVAIAAVKHWRPSAQPGYTAAVAIAAAVLPAKLFQEWFLHHYRWLDNFTALEFLGNAWDGLTWPLREAFGAVSLL